MPHHRPPKAPESPRSRPARRYRSAVRTLEDRVALSASPGPDFDVDDVSALLGGMIPAGSYDPTFSDDGIQTLPSTFGSNDVVRDMARQSDGKLVVVGIQADGHDTPDSFVLRYQADGTLDTSFGEGGRVRIGNLTGSTFAVHAVKIAADGKIVLAGEAGMQLYAGRLNADGSLDEAFGTRGAVLFGPAGITIASSASQIGMALQADGSILVARYGQSNVAGFVGRVTAAGVLDTSFNGTGFASLTPVSANDSPRDIAVQSDGKIVVVGSRQSSGFSDFFAARFLSTGALDSTFGSGGIAVVNIAGTSSTVDTANRVALQSDGKIVVAGTAGSDFCVVRFNTDGTLDTSFDGDGRVVTNLAGTENGLALGLTADGRIVVAGSTGPTATADFAVLRYTSTGALDATFDGDGVWVRSTGAGADQAAGLIILADGRMVVAGTSAEANTAGDVVLVGIDAAGGLDPSFGAGGISTRLNLGAGSSGTSDMIVLADGRMLVAGGISETSTSSGRTAVWRLLADGTLDTSFGSGGVFVTGNATTFFPPRLARQSDGKILVLEPSTSQRLLRLTSEGVLDTSFDGDGILSLSTQFTFPFAVNVAADDSIVVAGSVRNFTTGFDEVAVVRYTAGGVLDATFGVGGRRLVDVGAAHDTGLTIAFQADGKILVASSDLSNNNSYFGLVRLNVDGSLDTTFSDDGKIVQNSAAPFVQMTAVYVRADGRIILGGYDNGEFTLFRYLADGTLDASFGVGGRVTTPMHRGGQVYRILEQADGRLIAVGNASAKRADPMIAAVRYSADGVIDTTFDGEDGIITYYSGNLTFVTAAPSAALAPDGNLLIAGQSVVGDHREAIVFKILTAPEAAGAAPTISALAPQTVAEGGSFSFNFTTTDADTAADRLRFSVESSDRSLIAPENVTFTHLGAGLWSASVDARDHRFGATILTIKVSDGASTASQSFAVTVQPVNDAPTFVPGADVEASAGVAMSIRGWASGVFAGAADEFHQTLSFLVTGFDPALFDVAPVISSDGTLTFTAKASAAGQTALVTVRLFDDGGTAAGGVDASVPRTFAIRIGQGPIIGAIADQTIAEGGSTGPLNFAVLDADTAAGGVTVTVASSDTAILPASGLVLTNLGSGNYRIVATPAADRYGPVVVTVTASDGVRTTSRQFAVNVTPVNDVPSFVKGVDQFAAASDGPRSIVRWAKNISAGAQEASQQLTFVVTVDDPSLFAVGPAITADGTLSFTPAAGKSGFANVTVRLQDDGGTGGGGVDTSASQSFAIRVVDVGSTAGVVDPTFGSDGTVSSGSSFTSGMISRDVAVQADGKIIVAISDTPGVATRLMLVRLQADGALDSTFGVGGYAANDLISTDTAAGLKIGGDGKIYVGLSGSGDFQMVRFLADGTLDASFGVGGVATAVNVSASESVGGFALQADGRIVVVGTSGGELAAVRFTAAGVLDTSFGVGGFFRRAAGSFATLSDVAVDNDGSIVAVGRGRIDGSPSDTDVAVLRLTAGGVLDTGFSGDGIALVSRLLSGTIRTDQGERVLIDGLGRILIAGSSSSAFALLRLEADGTRDASFGTEGWVLKEFSSTLLLHGLATTPDGRIVAVGEYGDEDELAVVQYLADGSIDTSFDHDGLKMFSFGPGEDEAFGVTVDALGRVVFVGQATTNSNADVVVVRLAADGSNDTTFDGDGIRTITTPASRQFASVVRTSDGKYLVGGVSYQVSGVFPAGRLSVTRYFADGTIDASFGVGGTAVHPQSGAGSAMIALAADGKILAVPAAGLNGSSGLVRFNADGSPDTSFAGDGSAAFPASFNSHNVVVQSDGKIVVAGTQSSNFAVVRYNADGTLDTSYSGDGLFTLDLGGTETARAVALLSDGRMLAAGSTTATNTDFVVLRILADGTLDASFDGDGWVRTPVGTSTDNGFSIVVMPDGRFVVGGTVSTGQTSTDWGLVRYQDDGSLDTTFDGDGKVIFAPGTGIDAFGGLKLQADGKLVVVGTAVNGTATDTVVARFLPSGKLDPTFAGSGVLIAPQGAGIDAAQSLTFDADGRIVIAGYAEINGRYEGTLIRLLNEVDVAPAVTGVYVRGSAWNAAYLNHLDTLGAGDAEVPGLGYALAAGGSQLTATIAWSNVNRITVRFDRDVDASVDGLVLINSTGDMISATSFRYIDGRTVEWTVPVLPSSKYLIHLDSDLTRGLSGLELDGEWTTSSTSWTEGSGDDAAGGDFNFRFNSVMGDFDSSGSVSFGEYGQARLKLGLTTATVGYDFRQDLDGSAAISFGELGQMRANIGIGLSGFAEPPLPPEDAFDDGADAVGDSLAGELTPLTEASAMLDVRASFVEMSFVEVPEPSTNDSVGNTMTTEFAVFDFAPVGTAATTDVVRVTYDMPYARYQRTTTDPAGPVGTEWRRGAAFGSNSFDAPADEFGMFAHRFDGGHRPPASGLWPAAGWRRLRRGPAAAPASAPASAAEPIGTPLGGGDPSDA